MISYGYTLKRIVEPPVEPVTLAEAKSHLRIDTSLDDTQISGLITAARMWAETVTRRAFVEQKWRLTLDTFPPSEGVIWDGIYDRWLEGVIELPRPILIAVDSFSYVDAQGVTTTLTDSEYRVLNNTDQPARVLPAYEDTWPDTRLDFATVTIEYRSGYASAGSPTDAVNVPQPIKEAIKLHVEAHYDRDMESMDRLLRAAKNLLSDYRVHGY